MELKYADFPEKEEPPMFKDTDSVDERFAVSASVMSTMMSMMMCMNCGSSPGAVGS
jgi:hypothetical protein